jgi:hypothetical protein
MGSIDEAQVMIGQAVFVHRLMTIEVVSQQR